MQSELFIEVSEGVEGVGVIETLLILAVTAFNFAAVARRVRANQRVLDTKVSSRLFKERHNVTF